jgi:hypothetical protein
MMNRTSVRALLIFISLAMTSVVPFAFAQSSTPSSRITQAIDETERATLAGTTPKAIKTAHDLGTIEGNRSFQRMMLVLTPSSEQQASLKRLVENQHNKNSADYHKWLTPAQFAAKFGPSDDDLAQVKGWLQSQGLNPTGVGKARQWIEFSGNVQQVNSAFRTSIHRFESNGNTHIANSSDISIPAALTPVVSGVLSLNDFRTQPAHSKVTSVKRNDKGKLVPVDPNFTSIDSNGNYLYYLAPADFQRIYNASPLLKSNIDGTGISIAVAGRSDIDLVDVQAFRKVFGLSQNDPNFIVNGPDPGTPNSNDMSESSLDVEWAGAVAPGATINFVASANTDTTDGVDLSSAYIVDNALSPIMSVSYGLCEPLMGPTENQFYNALWRQAAAEGITVFVSTGDVGAAQCDGDMQNRGLDAVGPAQYGPTISGLSSTPYNVAVGGTQFNEANNSAAYWSLNSDSTSESALGYIPEQAWNESCDPQLAQTGTNCVNGQTSYHLESDGGGPSNCSQSSVDGQGNVTCIAGYAKPSWQTGIGVPSDGVRDTPDLSLNASPDDEGYLFCFLGSCQTATINSQTVLNGASVVGGTSASAPSMAGIMALVEHKNGAFQGQANYVFYKLAAMDSGSSCDSSAMTDPTQPSLCNFHDITMGSNSVPGLPGYGTSTAEWSAGVGYDMATGLGTVNAANLAANWGKVTVAGSATTLTASGTTLSHGQPLTINIAVKPANGGSSIPTGDVALATDKYGDVAHVTLDATGKYSGPVSNLPGGTYNLTARYGGDGTFGASVSAPVSLTVASEDSKTSFQLSVTSLKTNKTAPYAGTQQYGDILAFSIDVASNSGNGSPTGTINILNGGTVIMSAPLNSSGTVYLKTGYGTSYTFPAGTSTVSVQYLGDNSFNPSTSASTPVNVVKQQVGTSLGISGDNVPAGQPVFWTGSIYTPSSARYAVQLFPTPPTGTMQFYDNGTPVGGPIAIVDGAGYPQAPYTATLTTTGTHNITAAYSGDSNYTAVSGTDPIYAIPSEYTVVPSAGAATVTSIVQTPTAVTFGQSFSYVVTVTPVKKGGPVPTGSVSFSGNGNIFGSVTLINGQGTLTEYQVGAGTVQEFAQYQGDSNYAPSTSSTITTTIAKITTPVSLTTAAPYVLSGQQTSLNFVVMGFVYGTGQYGSYNAEGTVQFFNAVNGGTTQAITAALAMGPVGSSANVGLSIRVALPTGTNVVTARYSGDSYFNPETTAPVTIVVSNPDFAVSSNPSSLTILAGGSTTNALTVAPILGFSGAVSLSCASGLPAGTTCSFSPSAVPSGGGQSSLTIAMQGPFATQASNKKAAWVTVSELCGLVGLFFVGFSNRRKKLLAAILAVVAVSGFLSGCGGGAAPSSTVVVVSSSQPKIASGTAVTFTTQVSGGNDAPSGSVTFYDGTTALGNAAALSNGQASLQVSSLTVGTHSITAKYSGDSSHDGSISAAYYEAVTGATTLQVVATSGGLSHTLDINLAVQ